MTKNTTIPARSLSRGLVRASWHKQNLYNIVKKDYQPRDTQSLYQQKWEGKRETRAYHGDHLTERQWQGLFQSKLIGAVPLSRDSDKQQPSPLAMQLYAPIERRLDMAMFRAMFAGSPQQARQLIIKGKVKVNGEKVVNGFYPLKPGDIFSVDPEFVLMATGRNKPTTEQSENIDEIQRKEFEQFIRECERSPESTFKTKFTPSVTVDGPFDALELYREIKARAAERLGDQINQLKNAEQTDEELVEIGKAEIEKHKDAFQASGFVKTGDEILDGLLSGYFETESDLKASEKNDKLKDIALQMKQSNLAQLVELVKVFRAPATEYDPRWYYPYLKEYSGRDLPWQDGLYGLSDPSKRYFTPWTPRTYLAPFAIVPWHLEISFLTCQAVYLRDPVTRPGHTEVISPLPLAYHENAFLFYVGNRR